MPRFLPIFVLLFLTGSSFAADIKIDADTTYNKSAHEGNNLLITGGKTLTFEDCATSTATAMVFTLGDSSVTGDTGNILFHMTTPRATSTHGTSYSIANTDGQVTFTGSGNVTIQGGGDVATYCGGDSKTSAITFSLAKGSTISVMAGRFINGGWGFQKWSQNYADLYLAEGATIDLWDGASMYVNALNGGGLITPFDRTPRGPMYIGNGDGSGSFSGTIEANASIIKVGTGTQEFTGANSQASLKISNGTIKLSGNGAPCASGKTITIESNGTLEIANDYSLASNSFSGSGKILTSYAGTTEYQSSSLTSFTGTMEIGAGNTLQINETVTPKQKFAGSGNLEISSDGVLKITAPSSLTTKITGTGTLEYTTTNGNFSAAQLACLENFEGTFQLDAGLVYFEGNTTNDKMTISLHGGTLRNYQTSKTVAANIRIDSSEGGLRPGWPSQTLTITGKVSDGASDTLNIVYDSNEGSTATWVILTNPSNDYTNTVVDHYLRVTATGALGTGTVTINSGKTLDLTSTAIAATRLKNSGTITSSSTGSPAQIIINSESEIPKGTISGNIQYVLAGRTNLPSANATTGGILVQNASTNNLYTAAAIGSGALVLDGGLLMNNGHGVGIYQPVTITAKGGSLRAGFNTAQAQGGLGVSGIISGPGKLGLNTGESGASPITLTGANTYSGGTTITGTGTNRIYIASSSPFGTGLVDASTNTTVFSFLTGGTYGRSFLTGAFNTTDSIAVSALKLNMNDTANSNTSSVWQYNTTYAYNTTIQTDRTTTLEFGKYFDDSGAVTVTNLKTGEKTTVLNAKKGWTTREYGTFTFEAGVPYEIDVRLGQGEGGVGVAKDGLNDDPNAKVGMGVRVAGTSDKFQPLTIYEDGNWAFTDGSFKTAARDWTLANDLKIGSNTLQIQNTGIGDVTLSGKVTGSGTLAISNTSELSSDLNGLVIFNGSPNSAADKFNVTVAADTTFTGNGTIPGNLTLEKGACFVMDESQNLGKLTVSGSLKAEEAIFNITQTTVDSDFKITKDGADLTNAVINFTYNGDPSELETLTTLTVVDAKNLTGLDSVKLNFDSATGARLAGYEFKNGQLIVQLGNTNSLPEPSTWVLLALALVCCWRVKSFIKLGVRS